MKKELTKEELLAQGFNFYKEFKGLDYTNSDKNRSRNIKRNLEGVYEYHIQKQKKAKGVIIQEAGIWIKESKDIFVEVCKTTKSLETHHRLLDFYLSNHTDYLTLDEIAEKNNASKKTIVEFEKYCREIGLMEERTEPTYKEVFNQYTGKTEQREVPTMAQYYYVSINGQTGKLATSREYYGQYWGWIYKRANVIASNFLKKNPQYSVVTEEVYKGFKKQAQAEFSKLFGHKVGKGNTRKIDVEKLVELGIDKKFSLEPLPNEKVYQVKTVDFGLIENDVYDITIKSESEEKSESVFTLVVPSTIGFGRISKIENFIVPVEPLYEQCIVA